MDLAISPLSYECYYHQPCTVDAGYIAQPDCSHASEEWVNHTTTVQTDCTVECSFNGLGTFEPFSCCSTPTSSNPQSPLMTSPLSHYDDFGSYSDLSSSFDSLQNSPGNLSPAISCCPSPVGLREHVLTNALAQFVEAAANTGKNAFIAMITTLPNVFLLYCL